jgi:hypothetical protein
MYCIPHRAYSRDPSQAMLTAWVMASENTESRVSSEGLDIDIDLLTFLACLISSLTSPNLFLDSAVAFFTVFTALGLRCVYHRRGGRCEMARTNEAQECRLHLQKVILFEVFCVKNVNRKIGTCKRQGKGKDALRRAGHMAAPSATLWRRVTFACVLSWTRLPSS